MQIPIAIQLAQKKAARDATKPTRSQRTAVRLALDSWAFKNYGYLHRRLFHPGTRDKLAEACTRVTDQKAIMVELDNTRFCLRESSLQLNIDLLLNVIICTLQDLSSATASAQEVDTSTSTYHPTLNDQETSRIPPRAVGTSIARNNRTEQMAVMLNSPVNLARTVLSTAQGVPPAVAQSLEQEQIQTYESSDQVVSQLSENTNLQDDISSPTPAQETPLLTMISTGPLSDACFTTADSQTNSAIGEVSCMPSKAQHELLPNYLCSQPSGTTLATNTNPTKLPTMRTRLPVDVTTKSLPVVPEQPALEQQAVSAVNIPCNLPPGITPEMYLHARQSVTSNMVLSSDLLPTFSTPQPQQPKHEPRSLTKPGANQDKQTNGVQRKRKQRTNDPIKVARRNIESRTSQVENSRRKKAMKQSSIVTSKGNVLGGET